MRHPICVQSNGQPSTSVASYAAPCSTMAFSTTEANGTVKWPISGTIDNLVVTIPAPGAGKSYAFTLRVNGVDSSLTCTISDANTTARDTTNSVSVTAGDLVTLKCVPSGTPAATGANGVFCSIESSGSTAKESAYAWPYGQLNATGTRWNGVFAGWTTWIATNGITTQNVVACAGTISQIYYELSGSPGVGKSYTFTLYLNDVKQDGAGGTTNTAVTISGASTSGGISPALAVAAGDRIYLECVPSGTPVTANARMATRFTATTDRQAQYGGFVTGSPFTASTAYAVLHQYASAWDAANEAGKTFKGGVTGFTLQGFQVALSGSPGVGKSYAFTARRNSTSPSGTPTATIADNATSASDGSGTVTVSDGDKVALQCVPSGSPTSRQMSWGFMQTTAAPAGGFNALLIAP